MEAQSETISKETTVENTPSFGQLLASSRGKSAPAPEALSSEAADSETAATAAPESTAATETKPADGTEAKPTTEAAPAVAPAEGTSVAPMPPTEPTTVPVAVVQAMREEMKALKAQLAAQAAPPPEQYQPEAAPVDPQYAALNEKFVNQSLKAAKRIYADFDPAFEAAKAACAGNPALAQTIVESDDPGEAAYQTGKNFLLAKEYGIDSVGNLNGLITAVEKKVSERLTKEFEAKHQASLTAKAAERSKTPTDITSARAAGGSVEPGWVPPSFSDHLKSVYKRR